MDLLLVIGIIMGGIGGLMVGINSRYAPIGFMLFAIGLLINTADVDSQITETETSAAVTQDD